MKQLPTAEEFFNNKGIFGSMEERLSQYAIEFAKLHVQAALESALEDAPYGSSTDTVSYKDMKDAILNAYPLDNIK